MFIAISQIHSSAQTSFSANARKASSVQDTTALCLSTGSTNSQMMNGGVSMRRTTRSWRNSTVTCPSRTAQLQAFKFLLKGKLCCFWYIHEDY